MTTAPKDTDPLLQDMLDHPIAYIYDEAMVRDYRHRVIRSGVAFMLLGAAGLFIELTLQAAGVNLAHSFNDTTSTHVRGSVPIVLWYAFVLLSAPYGLYVLCTIKRHMDSYARSDLISQNPDFKRLHDERGARRADRLNAAISAFSNGLTRVFIGALIVLCVSVVVVCIAIVWLRAH